MKWFFSRKSKPDKAGDTPSAVQYDVPEIGVSLSLPSDFQVALRDVYNADPSACPPLFPAERMEKFFTGAHYLLGISSTTGVIIELHADRDDYDFFSFCINNGFAGNFIGYMLSRFEQNGTEVLRHGQHLHPETYIFQFDCREKFDDGCVDYGVLFYFLHAGNVVRIWVWFPNSDGTPEQDALANSIVDTLVLSEVPNDFPAGLVACRVEDIGISLLLPADSHFFMHDSEEPFLKARYGCTAEEILRAFSGEEPGASAVMLYKDCMAYAVFSARSASYEDFRGLSDEKLLSLWGNPVLSEPSDRHAYLVEDVLHTPETKFYRTIERRGNDDSTYSYSAHYITCTADKIYHISIVSRHPGELTPEELHTADEIVKSIRFLPTAGGADKTQESEKEETSP